MNDQTTTAARPSDTIRLKRGKKTVTYEKVPDKFAVRLKEGHAPNETQLEEAVGEVKTAVRHVDVDKVEDLDFFAVAEPAKLEETMDEMRDAPAADVVTHVYRVDDTPGGEMVPTGTLTVQFKPGIPKAQQSEILGEHGLDTVEYLDFLPNAYTVRLTAASTENPLKIAAKLQQRDEIEAAEPDLSFQVELKYAPTDTLYGEQWHLRNRGNRIGLIAGADVKAEDAWEISRGARDIVVCVMDDGFDLAHPKLNAPGKVVAPRDLNQNDNDPNPVFFDDNHGTACAGVAIAEETGVGVVGLAPGCAFMPVRMAPRLSDNAVVTLFRHAIDNQADVISCSWSASAWNFPLSIKIDGIIRQAATQGRRNGKGCVILFAAGNENRPLDGIASNGTVSHQGFALHDSVIAVGASNSRDERSSYSNFGPELTLCAPSSGSPGRRIVTTDRRGGLGYSAGDYTFDFGGTSSATPLAAGLAALILSLNPELTSAKVRQIMMETADKIDLDNGEYVDGHSPWYGHGRINAFRALQQVGAVVQPQTTETLAIEHGLNKQIVDLAGTIDAIPFPLDVSIGDLDLHYELTHERPQDLRLVVESPQGDRIVLRDREAGNSNVRQVFRSHERPELFANVRGKSAAGTWQLKIDDVVAAQQGTLLRWGLTVTYSA